MKYKGYNVPDVGEFVSGNSNRVIIATQYCVKASFVLKCDGKCKTCLFCNNISGEENNKRFEYLIQWHEARLKEAK